jgi:putative transposase
MTTPFHASGRNKAVYVDNGSAFVDNWLLRSCTKLGIRLTHSTPGGCHNFCVSLR